MYGRRPAVRACPEVPPCGTKKRRSPVARAPWPYAAEDARKFVSLPIDPMFPRFLITRARDAEVVGCIGIDAMDEIWQDNPDALVAASKHISGSWTKSPSASQRAVAWIMS